MTTRLPLLELGSLQSRLPDLIAKKGEPPWSEALVLTDDIQAFLICHPPGQLAPLVLFGARWEPLPG